MPKNLFNGGCGMKRTFLLFTAVLFLITACSVMQTVNKERTGTLLQKRLKTKLIKTVEFNYLLYLPENFAETQKQWPLLIFLHGIGERGNNLNVVTRHGPPKLIKQGKSFPFIVVAPQCPADQWWDADELDAWLTALLKQLPVDRKRIYLTGLSMGGFGTWAWAAKHPERFAAIAPICGGGNPFDAEKLKNIPIWVFHGAKDAVVPIKRSQEMVEALKRVGANVKFTIYPEAGHDAWTQTYANDELYEWFLQQVKQ